MGKELSNSPLISTKGLAFYHSICNRWHFFANLKPEEAEIGYPGEHPNYSGYLFLKELIQSGKVLAIIYKKFLVKKS